MIVDINLLPKVHKESKFFQIFVVLLVIIWLAIGGYLVYLYFDNRNTIAANDTQIQSLTDQRTILDVKLKNLAEAEANTQVVDPVAIINMIKELRVDAGKVLDQLNFIMPNGGMITNIAYTNHGQIALVCYFDDMEDASRYLFDLRSLQFGKESMLNSITKQDLIIGEVIDDFVSDDPFYEAPEPETKPVYVATYTITLTTGKEGGTDNGSNQ